MRTLHGSPTLVVGGLVQTDDMNSRPKGGIEQARRNFMRDDPELYGYIEARVAARELERAGDDASGAVDNYGAANRAWASAARWEAKWRAVLGDIGVTDGPVG